MKPSGLRLALVCLGTFAIHRPACAAVIQKDIAAIRGDQSRALLGTGAGVIIGVVDSGIDVNHPALRGSVIASHDFTADGTTDDGLRGLPTGHSTGIAGVFVGHDAVGGYTGLAPAAKVINARVNNTRDHTTENLIGTGMFWSIAKGAKVINISLGDNTTTPDDNKLNLMTDYAIEHYGATVVIAAGNDNGSAVQGSPGGSYNGIAVGATTGRGFGRVALFSDYALATDVRSKPDLVAPGDNVALAAADWEKADDYYYGTGTSFSAPMVGGVVAQLMGYGNHHGLSTSPLVMKAVLMTGAAKVADYDGSAWTPRDTKSTADGVTVDEPLDDEQGAGRVDGVGAYQVYARKTDASTRYANWKLANLRAGGIYTLTLGTLRGGERVDTTLTWLRHVLRKDNGNGTVDGLDTYTAAAKAADFSLTLLCDGKRVVMSDSDADNVEHLSWAITQSGSYSLAVYRYADGSGLTKEDFALAARVLALGATTPSAQVTATSLAVRPAVATAPSGGWAQSLSSVPEPGSAWVVGLTVAIMLRRRRTA